MTLPEIGGITFKYAFNTYRGIYIKNPPDISYIQRAIALQHREYTALYLDRDRVLHLEFPDSIPEPYNSYMIIMENQKLDKRYLFKSLVEAMLTSNGLDLSPKRRALSINEVRIAPEYIPDNPYTVMWHFIHAIFVYRSTFTFN